MNYDTWKIGQWRDDDPEGDQWQLATCEVCQNNFAVRKDDDDRDLCDRCEQRAKVTPEELWERR